MITTNETEVTRHPSGNKLIMARKFNAPIAKVWKAWTESNLLDKWWAPRPWKAETKSQDFTEGGMWLYAMVGPEGERNWCRADYKSITQGKSFVCETGFCDEDGIIINDVPLMRWHASFAEAGNATVVTMEITFDSAADLEKIVEMGFKEGFTMAHGNLDEMLAE